MKLGLFCLTCQNKLVNMQEKGWIRVSSQNPHWQKHILNNSSPPKQKPERALPATEFGLGIMSEEDACDGYGTGPSGEWTGGCGAPAEVLVCCGWSILDGVSVGVAEAPLESSSATGEQVSARTLCARPWRLLPLRLPSLLHSRLEPLRSSFSEELVMVAESKEDVTVGLKT